MARPSSPVARLTDIIEAIELIRTEMAGVSLAAFEPDRRKRWLVERGIEIISEASRHLSEELKRQAPGNSVAEGGRHRQCAAARVRGCCPRPLRRLYGIWPVQNSHLFRRH